MTTPDMTVRVESRRVDAKRSLARCKNAEIPPDTGIEVKVDGVRQDAPQRMENIRHEGIVDSDEPDHRLELLHENVKQDGTVFHTVAPAPQ